MSTIFSNFLVTLMEKVRVLFTAMNVFKKIRGADKYSQACVVSLEITSGDSEEQAVA